MGNGDAVINEEGVGDWAKGVMVKIVPTKITLTEPQNNSNSPTHLASDFVPPRPRLSVVLTKDQQQTMSDNETDVNIDNSASLTQNVSLDIIPVTNRIYEMVKNSLEDEEDATIGDEDEDENEHNLNRIP
jgi:hypothetical protein